jgi:hypothetical protein
MADSDNTTTLPFVIGGRGVPNHRFPFKPMERVASSSICLIALMSCAAAVRESNHGQSRYSVTSLEVV